MYVQNKRKTKLARNFPWGLPATPTGVTKGVSAASAWPAWKDVGETTGEAKGGADDGGAAAAAQAVVPYCGVEKTTGEAKGGADAGSAGGGAAAAAQASEEVGINEALQPGATIGMAQEEWYAKFPDCNVGMGCWTASNKSINTHCRYKNDPNTPCPLKEARGPIEVKMKGADATGRYECVVCFHQRARERDIWLCTGKACRATRKKYGVESPDDVASASADVFRPPPPPPQGPPGAPLAGSLAYWQALAALQKQVTQISDVVHKMKEELTELRTMTTQIRTDVRALRCPTEKAGDDGHAASGSQKSQPWRSADGHAASGSQRSQQWGSQDWQGSQKWSS